MGRHNRDDESVVVLACMHGVALHALIEFCCAVLAGRSVGNTSLECLIVYGLQY